MSKHGKRKGGAPARKKRFSFWQLAVALVVVVALAFSRVLFKRDSSVEAQKEASSPTAADPLPTGSPLRNRLVLPARPQSPRPFTLSPASFQDPETRRAYQIAKDNPELLEHMACYCGCFANAGHRTNLDCFHDNHGAT